MKIVDNRNEKLTFKELVSGDVFCDEDGDILMKIPSSFGCNAIKLNTTPTLYDLSPDYAVVEVLNATLVIKN